MQFESTLCWDCAKAATGECSWSDKLEPVPGWTAEETIIRINTEAFTNSYLVRDCPEFVPDIERR